MFVTSVRAIALAGVVLAALALPAQASHNGGACCEAPASDSCAPAPAPVVRTVRVLEWVPETYKATVTRYRTESVEEKYTAQRMECVEENYTAYRTECVSETRTRKVVCNKVVPVESEVTCTVYKCVPTTEQRTCTRMVVSYNTVTEIVNKCVDRGHYETQCVEDTSCLARLRHRCHKPSCCEPCPPPPTKVKKVWVPCMVTIQVPVCRTVKVCTPVTETVNVTVNKMVPEQQTRKVTTYKCVSEEKEEQYTCMVPKQVAYQATRKVAKCVPYEATRTVCKSVPYTEEVTCTRMVCRYVEKQVTETCCPAIPVYQHGCCGGRRGLFH
jgi:hypothetical protein